MSKTDISPHVCYYASILARAFQEDNDTFSALHDIIAQRISSSPVKLDEIEKLAQEYTDHPKHLLLSKIRWLEDRGIKPLRVEKVVNSTKAETSEESSKAEPCERAQTTLQLVEDDISSIDQHPAFIPEQRSLTDICQKMEQRQRKLMSFGVTAKGDGNNNIQSNDAAKQSYGVSIGSSDGIKDKKPICTVIEYESLKDYDVSSTVKFDFLQPTTRTSKKDDALLSKKRSPIEMQEIKKDTFIDKSWDWGVEDKSETNPNEEKEENVSAKKKKKKKKSKKPGDESATDNITPIPDENAESKSVNVTKSSRAARRKKLAEARKLESGEVANQSEPATLPENEIMEIKPVAEQPTKRKRSIKEFKKNKLKEELEKRSGKNSPVNEFSQLTMVSSANYGSTCNANAVKELETLMSTSSSTQGSSTEHKRPKKDKKDSKNKSKHKEGQKSSSHEQTSCKPKSEKRPNTGLGQPNQESAIKEESRGDTASGYTDDVQWPFLKHQRKNLTFGSHTGGNTGGTSEIQIPKGGKSYASKVRDSLQLDSAGGSLASSCEDSSSSTSSNGTREFNAEAERSPSPASLPDLSKSVREDQKQEGVNKTDEAVQSPESFGQISNRLAGSSVTIDNSDMTSDMKLDVGQGAPPCEGGTSNTDIAVTMSEPKFPDSAKGCILPSDLKDLLSNDWGLDFFNDRVVNDDVKDNASECAGDENAASSLLDFKFDASESLEAGDAQACARDSESCDNEDEIQGQDSDSEADARRPVFDHDSALKFIWKEWLSATRNKK